MNRNRLDVLDGNMMAYLDYSRRVDEAEKVGKQFEQEIKPILEEIGSLVDEIRLIVKDYEKEHSLDFSDEAKEALKTEMETLP